MKLLSTKTNVDAPSGTWPFGDLRDDTGGGDGTPIDKELITDIQQFFERMFSQSGIVANGLPDNQTNGFQLWDAFRGLTRPYKVYVANLTQVAGFDPFPKVMQNELAGAVVWTRLGVGDYRGTLVGAFLSIKTAIIMNGGIESQFDSVADRFSDDAIRVRSFNAGFQSDNSMIGVTIEIRVYD